MRRIKPEKNEKVILIAALMLSVSQYVDAANAKREKVAFTVLLMPDGSTFRVEGELSASEILGYYDYWDKYGYPER